MEQSYTDREQTDSCQRGGGLGSQMKEMKQLRSTKR